MLDVSLKRGYIINSSGSVVQYPPLTPRFCSQGCRVSSEVGYKIRFDDHTSKETTIKYMTDGVLVRESLTDPNLSQYAIIMLVTTRPLLSCRGAATANAADTTHYNDYHRTKPTSAPSTLTFCLVC